MGIVLVAEQATEKVTFRLTETQVEILDAIAFRKGLKSRSEAIRTAVESYITENSRDHRSRRLSLKFPPAVLAYLEGMVEDGEILSAEAGVLDATKQFIKQHQDFYLHEWPKIHENRRLAREDRENRVQIVGGEP